MKKLRHFLIKILAGDMPVIRNVHIAMQDGGNVIMARRDVTP